MGRTGEVVFQGSNLVRKCAESRNSAERVWRIRNSLLVILEIRNVLKGRGKSSTQLSLRRTPKLDERGIRRDESAEA
jgi:hypothetical protein